MDRNGKRRKKNKNYIKMDHSKYNQHEDECSLSTLLLLNPIVIIKEEKEEEIHKTDIKVEAEDEENFMTVFNKETSSNDNEQDPFSRIKSPPQQEQKQSERATVEMKYEVDEENWMDEREQLQEIHQCSKCLKNFHLHQKLESHLKICHLNLKRNFSTQNVIIKQESNNNMDFEPIPIIPIVNSDVISNTFKNSQRQLGQGKKRKRKKKIVNNNNNENQDVPPSVEPWDLCTHIKWDCHLCPAKFLSSSQLTNHLCSHLYLKPISCNLCRRSMSRNHLKIHMSAHIKTELNGNRTKSISIHCALCEEDFPARSQGYIEHIQCVMHKEWHRPFRCAMCHLEGKNRLFASKKLLEFHQINMHRRRPYFCAESTTCPCSIERGKNLYKCDRCSHVFKKGNKLTRHKRNCHTFFSCEKCGLQFEGRRMTANHTRCCSGKIAATISSPVENNNIGAFVETQDSISIPIPASIKRKSSHQDSSSKSILNGGIRVKVAKKSDSSLEFLPYKCSLCPLAFPSKHLYHSHIGTHMF